jgi:hypothetical protein
VNRTVAIACTIVSTAALVIASLVFGAVANATLVATMIGLITLLVTAKPVVDARRFEAAVVIAALLLSVAGLVSVLQVREGGQREAKEPT